MTDLSALKQANAKPWKERLGNAAMTVAIVLMALAIPFGFGMGLYTNNGDWFWLCGFLILFLS